VYVCAWLLLVCLWCVCGVWVGAVFVVVCVHILS
jgi:hypothetical protein